MFELFWISLSSTSATTWYVQLRRLSCSLRQNLALREDTTQAWWRKQLPCWMPWLHTTVFLQSHRLHWGFSQTQRPLCFISVFSVRIYILGYIFPIYWLIIIFRYLGAGMPKFQTNPNVLFAISSNPAVSFWLANSIEHSINTIFWSCSDPCLKPAAMVRSHPLWRWATRTLEPEVWFAAAERFGVHVYLMYVIYTPHESRYIYVSICI